MAEENGSDKCDALELRDHLENLPQALYDCIYDLTFTTDAKIRIYASRSTISNNGLEYLVAKHTDQVAVLNEPLSHLLWVCRSSRKKFASSLLEGGSIFVFYDSIGEPLRDLICSDGTLRGDIRIVLGTEWSKVFETEDYKKSISLTGLDQDLADQLRPTTHLTVWSLLEERGDEVNGNKKK
ncbi:hypothetical protein CKM354_000442500 [Cercospora kikuchii]|uniref:Uncharacterized protein n=1 Tax=Cercospora kikuchii TaxID=84275 RepID=A0A9P3CBF2_9PEZI|nr:uncharacterized protein CKM354_000442500 [Cercospora kikuchii]GIZ41109.1 hypothetical protein CKM354_000442500 [Cercospora kikuchii]